jgi:nicotinate phosphoribosyltransferase
LAKVRFSGELFAMPEGRLFFQDEPILEITAPITEAQLIESFIMNAINLEVTIATKAARCVHAAQSKPLVDFSLRRTQGIDAGLKVARTSYIAGFAGTSNVLAGKLYDIPLSGTMAHSFIASFEEEIDAFRAFAETFSENTVLLIDTYDTLAVAQKAAIVGREMIRQGKRLKGVRLDSGDMASLSKEVKAILEEAGLADVQIFASGGFDEYKIAQHLREDVKIDAFGVGTKMGVSADAPYTDIAYKLVEYDDRPVLKLSTGKQTLAGKKQVFRIREGGRLIKDIDIIALRGENLEDEPMLRMAMEDGGRCQRQEPLLSIRDRFQQEFMTLDENYKVLIKPQSFPVELSPGLRDLQRRVVREVKEKELGKS